MNPKIEWLKEIREGISQGVVTLLDLDPLLFDKIGDMVGRVNSKPIAFSNHIALKETLLLAYFSVGRQENRIKSSLYFNWSGVIGICGDGIKRHVGLNRVKCPDGKYYYLNDSDNERIYPFDTEIDRLGFASLWQK